MVPDLKVTAAEMLTSGFRENHCREENNMKGKMEYPALYEEARAFTECIHRGLSFRLCCLAAVIMWNEQ
jgi:hypothetical protein